MKPTFLLIAISALLLSACEHYDKRADGSISYKSYITDAEATVVDGPLPVLAGMVPVYNKKGVIVGQRAIYTAGTSTERVGYASFGRNQSNGLEKVTKLVGKGIDTWGIVQSLDRYFDSEDATTATAAATEKARIDGSNQSAQIAADKEITLEKLKIEAAEAAPAP